MSVIIDNSSFLCPKLASLLSDRGHRVFVSSDAPNFCISDERVTRVNSFFSYEDIDRCCERLSEMKVSTIVDPSFLSLKKIDPVSAMDETVKNRLNLLSLAFEYWNRLPDAEKKRFIFVQTFTTILFGDRTDKGPSTVDSQTHPETIEAAVQSAIWHFSDILQKQYQFPIIFLVTGNIYGCSTSNLSFVEQVIEQTVARKTITIYGKGDEIRNWTSIEDFCDFAYLSISRGKPGEKYFLSDNIEIQYLEIAKEICKLYGELTGDKNFDGSSLIKFSSRNIARLRKSVCKVSASLDDLGFSPRRQLFQEIRHMLADAINKRDNTYKS